MKREYPPAIPDGETPLLDPSRWYEVHETCTAFEDRDRAIVAHFRRSHKFNLRGQVKLDV